MIDTLSGALSQECGLILVQSKFEREVGKKERQKIQLFICFKIQYSLILGKYPYLFACRMHYNRFALKNVQIQQLNVAQMSTN